MTGELTYWQKELGPLVARLNGSTYEVYSSEFGRWDVANRNVGPDIVYSGNWYQITEEEALKIIADFASGAFFTERSRETQAEVASEWTKPPTVVPMTGVEPFIGIDGTVTDFWRFAMSDFRTNNLRGYLAEFIVARAVGSDQYRVEWDAYDVITPGDEITIEVKSSAYLQAWAQRKPSAITFSSLRGSRWTPQTGYAAEKTYNADVYVFCVQTSTDYATYNPLDVSQWDFYVVSNAALSTLGQKSVSLSRVRELSGGVVAFAGLEAAVKLANRP